MDGFGIIHKMREHLTGFGIGEFFAVVEHKSFGVDCGEMDSFMRDEQELIRFVIIGNASVALRLSLHFFLVYGHFVTSVIVIIKNRRTDPVPP